MRRSVSKMYVKGEIFLNLGTFVAEKLSNTGVIHH